MKETITVTLFVKGTDGEESREHQLDIYFEDHETWSYDLPEWADDSDTYADIEGTDEFFSAHQSAIAHFQYYDNEPLIQFQ